MSEDRVVALLTYPIPAGGLEAAVRALQKLYGKGLMIDTAHPLAGTYMVICRPDPDPMNHDR